MKISAGELRRALDAVSAIKGKQTIPILNMALFEPIASGARVTATDFDVTVKIDIRAFGEFKPFLLPLTQLQSALKGRADDNELRFAFSDEKTVITVGKGTYKIGVTPADQYPVLDDVPDVLPFVQMQAETLRDVVTHTAYACADSVTRYTLQAIHFSERNGHLVAAATDTNVLAVYESDVECDEGADILIPKEAGLIAARLCSGSVAVHESPNHVAFKSEGVAVIARKLAGQFPNYWKAIPTDYSLSVAVPVVPALLAVERCSGFAYEIEKHRAVKLRFDEGRMEVSSRSEDGDVSEVVELPYDGESVELAFKLRYVKDVLSRHQGEVFAEYKSERNALVLRGDKSFAVILPMRLF